MADDNQGVYQPIQNVKPKTVGALSSLNTISDPKPMPQTTSDVAPNKPDDAPVAAAPSPSSPLANAISSTAGTIGDAAKGALNYGNNIAKTLIGGAGQIVAPIGDAAVGAANLLTGNDPSSRDGGFFAGTKAANSMASDGLSAIAQPLNSARLGVGKLLGDATGASPVTPGVPAASPASQSTPAPVAAAPAPSAANAAPSQADSSTAPTAAPEGTIYASADGKSFSDKPIAGGSVFNGGSRGSVSVMPAANFVNGGLTPTIGSVAQASQQASDSGDGNDRGVEIGRQPSQEEQARQYAINNVRNAIAHNQGGVTGLNRLTESLGHLLGSNTDLKDQNVESEISARNRNADTNDMDAQTRRKTGQASIGEMAAQTAKLGTENRLGGISIQDAMRLNSAAEAYQQNPTEQNAQILRSLQGKEKQPRFVVTEAKGTDPVSGLPSSTPYALNNETGVFHSAAEQKASAQDEDPYQAGKVYPGQGGKSAKYLGNGKWGAP